MPRALFTLLSIEYRRPEYGDFASLPSRRLYHPGAIGSNLYRADQ